MVQQLLYSSQEERLFIAKAGRDSALGASSWELTNIAMPRLGPVERARLSRLFSTDLYLPPTPALHMRSPMHENSPLHDVRTGIHSPQTEQSTAFFRADSGLMNISGGIYTQIIHGSNEHGASYLQF